MFIKSVLLFFLLLILTILPEQVYGLYNDNYMASHVIKNIGIYAFLVALLTFAHCSTFVKVVLLLTGFWQCTQLMYFHYYGVFYSAFDMRLLHSEFFDAAQGFWDVINFLIWPFLLVVSCTALAVFIYHKLQPKCITYRVVSWVLLLTLLFPLVQAFTLSSSQKFQPNINQSALKNGLYATAYYLAYSTKLALNLVQKPQEYQPYRLNKVPVADANIVIIMGESLTTFNMGIFGYDRDTTPSLQQLISDPNFFYLESLSSAVSTRVSLALFFNTVYEPDNFTHLHSMNTSLFRLAKQAGFETHYLTTQKNAGGLTYSFSVSDIDSWKDNDDLTEYESHYDDRLLMELEVMGLDYDKPQFITLHMRSAHTPYIENYPQDREVYPVADLVYEDYMRNSYDNSVLYSDKLIVDIYKFFKKTKRPTYIFFTSDHGELLGQNGRFGHNQVDLDVARIPFLFYGANVEQKEITKLKQQLGCFTNHYQLSKVIAQLVGTQIDNPNEKDKLFYLNGTSVFGEAGFMSYQPPSCTN